MATSRRLPHLLALRAFESASRHLSFSRAAEELFVTQSAISRHIKNLEDSFQKKLFLRRGRSVVLSPEGQKFYEKLAVGFGLIDEATKAFAEERDRRILRINVLPTLGMFWLAPRLNQFSQAHPDIEVHLISSIDPVDFDRGPIDVAIRVGRLGADLEPAAPAGAAPAATPLAKIDLRMVEDWEGIESVPLFPDILVAVYNPERMPAPQTPEHLSEHVLISTMTRAHAWADWFDVAGLAPRKAGKQLSFGHFFMSLQAAIEGKGIAILPEVLVERELVSGRLARLFHKAHSAGQYYLLFRESDFENRKVQVFRRWLSGEAASYRQRLR